MQAFKEKEKKILKTINKDLDEALYKNENDIFLPWICLICDKFLKPWEIKYIKKEILIENSEILYPTSQRDLPNDILDYYTYNKLGTDAEIKQYSLSPRGIFIKNKNNISGKFVVCQICQNHFCKKMLFHLLLLPISLKLEFSLKF